MKLWSKEIEDAFFAKEDEKLIKEFQVMQKMNKTKKELSAVSGIKNEAVLEKLAYLNIRPETLASFSIIPLIEIAWADGKIDDAERIALLSAMEKKGISKQGDANFDVIKQWMVRKPSDELLEAWIHYIQGLCERLSEEEKKTLKDEIIGNAEAIAESSGGILGIGTISEAEKNMLLKLENAFN
jgi:hypothetical protein